MVAKEVQDEKPAQYMLLQTGKLIEVSRVQP
jgi:hypothetical protein